VFGSWGPGHRRLSISGLTPHRRDRTPSTFALRFQTPGGRGIDHAEVIRYRRPVLAVWGVIQR
jgi:hypothetical protein